MNKKHFRHLFHMLDCIERIPVHLKSGGISTVDELARDVTAHAAIERELYVITQCVKDIGPDIAEVSDELPWDKIV